MFQVKRRKLPASFATAGLLSFACLEFADYIYTQPASRGKDIHIDWVQCGSMKETGSFTQSEHVGEHKISIYYRHLPLLCHG